MNANSRDHDTATKLMNRPGFMFRRCSQTEGGFFEKACRELGLTTGQYDVLFVLANEGRADQDRVGQLLGLDRSTSGVLATNLERKGLISREVKTSDRRKRTLELTEDGKEIFTAAEPMANAAKERILAPLSTDERDQLFSLMSRIVTFAVDSDPEG